jgi:hypothetical protein
MNYEEEIMQFIDNYEYGTSQYKNKKKELLRRFKEDIAKEKLSEEKKNMKLKVLRKLLRDKERDKQLASGKNISVGSKKTEGNLDPILRMDITNESGVKHPPSTFTDRKLEADEIIVGNIVEEVLTNDYAKKLKAFAQALGGEKEKNLLENFKSIKRAMERKRKKEALPEVKTKNITIDVRKYLGATDLSKATTREGIYTFWEEVAKKYNEFDDALEEFFRNIMDEGGLKTLFSIVQEKGERAFYDEARRIYEKYGNENLEYLGDFTKAQARITADPKERLIEAFDRIITAEQLAEKKEALFEDIEEDTFESTQRAWEEVYMNEELNASKGGILGDFEIDLVDEEDEQDVRDLMEMPTDPLLAYELMKNKKLIALDDESELILKETLAELKKENLYLDFQTNLSELLDEVKDTVDIDKEKYVLPISILSNDMFAKYIDTTKVPSAINKKDITVEVLETIDELFEEIHALLSTEKFGFAMGVRATGRAGIGSSVERREARGTAIQRLAEEPLRTVPSNPEQRGKLKEEIEPILESLQKLLNAFADYYINPLYTGRLPIEIPLYSSGRGAKALSIFLKDVGGESLMAESYEKLSTIGRATISKKSMKDLADFLIKLESPKIAVNEDLIKMAKQASKGLTDMLGNPEKNHNYFSSVLMHFMEQTENLDSADEDFYGATIQDRADMFERDYENRIPYPIFALPQFVDNNQSLMTKDGARKEQYERLKSVLEVVEEDLYVTLTKLLKAHDEIRKALGKPVYYGFMPLTYDSYERMVDLLYQEQNVDLSHLEVSNIVKSDDAHKNISREYGITEEQVYLIKANFRC